MGKRKKVKKPKLWNKTKICDMCGKSKPKDNFWRNSECCSDCRNRKARTPKSEYNWYT